jgi:outer membrane lipoprotein SlyB
VYVDTLQGYYTAFDAQMADPYQEWRKLSYEETVTLRELRAESTRNLIIGGVAVLAGIAAATAGESSTTRTAGQVGVLGGGYLLKSGLDKRNEAQIHVEALDELGMSLESEITPQVIELEDRTVMLSGNVEEQYAQWRAVLADIYRAEIGALDLPEESAGTADTL